MLITKMMMVMMEMMVVMTVMITVMMLMMVMVVMLMMMMMMTMLLRLRLAVTGSLVAAGLHILRLSTTTTWRTSSTSEWCTVVV